MSVTRLEQCDGTTMVAYLSGDADLRWEEEEFTGYLWRDNKCGLVWTRKHQAENCESREHVVSYDDVYYGQGAIGPNGVREVKETRYTRRAVRREGSKAGEAKVPANARKLPAVAAVRAS